LIIVVTVRRYKSKVSTNRYVSVNRARSLSMPQKRQLYQLTHVFQLDSNSPPSRRSNQGDIDARSPLLVKLVM
uniref:Ovule protein n=1 Tax=Anisakis simplex TaxID=6269 RepID=A0A0M3JQK4_ANISI